MSVPIMNLPLCVLVTVNKRTPTHGAGLAVMRGGNGRQVFINRTVILNGILMPSDVCWGTGNVTGVLEG